jgi:purine catabolism regulator
MVNVANDSVDSAPELPPSSGITVRDLMAIPPLTAARVVAGSKGLGRIVRRANVMEVPDITRWVKSDELLLTTGYAIREAPEGLTTLIAELDDARVSAVAVKLHRYLDELPAEALSEADSRGLPILLLPDDAAFDEILNGTLSEILGRQSRLLERAEAVHRGLVGIVLAEGDVPDLVRELSRILQAWVAVTTPDGGVVSQARARDRRAAAPGEQVLDGTGRFRAETYQPGLHDVDRASLLVVPILAGHVDHGRLVAFGSRQRFSDDDAHILEIAATVAALSITKSLAVAAVESKYRGDFVKDVLLGRAGNMAAVVGHFRSLGWEIHRPLVLMVAEVDPSELTGDPAADLAAQERFRLTWSTVVSKYDERAPVVGFARDVVAIVGIRRGADVHDEVATIVAAVRRSGAGRRSFSAGVSRVIDRPSELPSAYEQARRAIHAGRQLHGAGAVAHFDDHGVVRLLSLISDTRELHRFVRETLGPLVDDGDPEMTDLRNTLRTLLDNSLNVAETARIMHFHYNTLRYRITKLERMIGAFTTDPARRLDLSLALRVMEMRGL